MTDLGYSPPSGKRPQNGAELTAYLPGEQIPGQRKSAGPDPFEVLEAIVMFVRQIRDNL